MHVFMQIYIGIRAIGHSFARFLTQNKSAIKAHRSFLYQIDKTNFQVGLCENFYVHPNFLYECVPNGP